MTAPAAAAPPPLAVLLARGWRKRCPRCGEGRLFKRLNVMHEHCAVCGLRYLEDQGDLFGYLFALDRVLFLAPLIGLVFLRVWVPSSTWFYGLWALAMLALVVTLPQRTGVGVALDYLRRRRRAAA
ncbi:MAG: DUF983 domain-containing protein [Deltaproteobacteria bacterium]|nr:DUF983 domain-containing protein [Deltaproteobacteria bacterium]